MKNSSHDIAKEAAGNAAAALVQDGMVIGLGTGSTASHFIKSLIKRCRDSTLKISAVATSERSAQQARDGGIHLRDINTLSFLDLAIDGADEIDPLKRMIKGGGGALLREKIIASMSREMIVIVDHSKLVNKLGAFPLPIEITPFAHNVTLRHVQDLGYNATFRKTPQGHLYITDNNNYIIDIAFTNGCASPETDQIALRSIPGVLETGFFIGLAGRVIVGQPDGAVTVIP